MVGICVGVGNYFDLLMRRQWHGNDSKGKALRREREQLWPSYVPQPSIQLGNWAWKVSLFPGKTDRMSVAITDFGMRMQSRTSAGKISEKQVSGRKLPCDVLLRGERG